LINGKKMKLDEVKKIDEMAKPANICPMCGNPSVGFHTYRNGEWKCKGSTTVKPGYPLPGATYMKATSKGSTAPSPAAAAPSAPARPVAAAPSAPEEKEDGSTLKDLLATKPVEPEKDVADEPEDTSSAPEDTGGSEYSDEQKRQIVSWLKERGGGVEPSMVSFSNGKINIDGTVDMEWRISDLTKAKFYFGEVTGDFSMSAARLETMAGFPEKVGTG